MRRKINTGDLKLGMYVIELDRPWREAPFEPPFEIQGFTLRKDEEIEKVRDLCAHVYINPELSSVINRRVVGGRGLKNITEVFGALSPASMPSKTYKDQTTLKQEAPVARQILDDTNQLYRKIIADLQQDRQPNAEEVKNVVTGLVESVVRNSEALTWLVGLKRKDATTYVHALSVSVLALTIGRYLGIPKDRLHVLGTATLLQDIGKMALSGELLSKAGDLNQQEKSTLKEHVNESVEMLQKSRNFNPEIIHTVHLHHERFNGSGYPQGLRGVDIPLLSIISGIVDCYQAGISTRPYRGAKTSFQVLMELYGGRDANFPGGVVEQFIQCVGIFPIGSFVKLNTGEIGVVVRRNQIQQLKPQVMVLIDRAGKRSENPETIDLSVQYLEPGKVPRLISGVVDPKAFSLDPGEFFV